MDHVVSPRRGRRRLGFVSAAALAALSIAACSGPTAGSPAAASGAAPSGAAIPADFPLLGAWVTSITKADLTAAGITDPGMQNENSGRFTWTFAADGTWTQVQESLDGSPINSPVFRGTFTVDDGSLVATTMFPDQYRDAGLHYEWTLDAGSVTFDVLDPPDEMLEAIVETHPWTRPS